MECLDSGMVMSKTPLTASDALPDCLRDAFRAEVDEGEVVVLIVEEEGLV